MHEKRLECANKRSKKITDGVKLTREDLSNACLSYNNFPCVFAFIFFMRY